MGSRAQSEKRPQVQLIQRLIAADKAGKPSQVRAPAGKWGMALQLEGLSILGHMFAGRKSSQTESLHMYPEATQLGDL